MMLKGIFNPHAAGHSGTTRLPVRVDERATLCPRVQLCQQASTVTAAYRQSLKERINDLVIDSTELKVFG
ncbi:hypothetical protein [Aeromonas salmonicida]|uniref:hypothetical protein n=1 Tax=Aeromonas salmonicida TaxID=645 RepID=UPI003B987E8E